jgi:hypothetical protein
MSAYLQYDFYAKDLGIVRILAYFSPSLNFHRDQGLQYGISLDNEAPQIISINGEDSLKKIWVMSQFEF